MKHTLKRIDGTIIDEAYDGTFAELVVKNKADLRMADFSWSDLCGARLTGTDLNKANLYLANLSGINLEGSNLDGANLYLANLRNANLTGARLTGADLSGAKLTSANLYRADLTGARLTGTDLSGALTEQTIISVSGIGSERRMTTYWQEADRVWCGCFTGTMAEFKKRIKARHDVGSKYRKQYLAAVRFLKEVRK